MQKREGRRFMFSKIKVDELIKLIKIMKSRKFIYLITLMGCSISFPAVQIIFSIVNKKIFNAIQYEQSKMIYEALVMIIVIFAIACIVDPISRYVNRVCIRKTMYELRKDIFSHIEKLPMKFFDTNHSGDLISRMTVDVNSIENAFFMYNLIECMLWGIGSAVTMLALDWRLALILIASGLLSMKLNGLFAKPFREISDRIQQQKGTLTKYFIDIVLNIRTIKMFNIENKLNKKYKDGNYQLVGYIINRAYKSAKLDSMNFLISAINLLGIISVGVFMVLHYNLDVGKIAAIVILQNGIITMFLQLGSSLVNLQASLAGTTRVLELLNQPHDNLSYASLQETGNESMIALKDIRFGYEKERRILDGINIKVERGQKAAIVGGSGAGKSTILKLLAGFYSADSGSIYIDNKSLSECTTKDIRKKVAYVSQSAFLFQGTIEENIRFGKNNSSLEEIVNAAIMAEAHEFIMNMPDGYNTVVGENGALLSGGQKQRIAIARAILKDSPILLLDEATSQLDSESEQLVVKALNTLIKGRTVITVAHRLSTIKDADVIYVIENGVVVESGNHANLINNETSKYRYLYNLQFGGQDLAC